MDDMYKYYAVTKLRWIRQQQQTLKEQARQSPRQFIERESHYLWGRRHLLTIIEPNEKPSVSVDHKRITLSVRPGRNSAKRAEVIHEWDKSLLQEFIPQLISKWEPKIGVSVSAYYLQRIKTKWGSCNHKRGNIRFRNYHKGDFPEKLKLAENALLKRLKSN